MDSLCQQEEIMVIDVLGRDDLPFPGSLPEFQRLLPDEPACAAYLERARWGSGFVCPHCETSGEPYRYETAFQILHKLRAAIVRPDQDRIGTKPEEHIEADETYVGGRTRGKARGVHDMVLVAGAVEVRQRKEQGSRNKRKAGRYAGRVHLAVAPNRSAKSLGGFIERTVTPGATIITDDCSDYAKLGERVYCHTAVAERGDIQIVETFLPIIHLVFSNLKTRLRGTHHGVSPQHLSAYLNEFTFRFNRRFYPFNSFRSLLGIAGDVTAPTYAELYAAKSRPTTSSGRL